MAILSDLSVWMDGNIFLFETAIGYLTIDSNFLFYRDLIGIIYIHLAWNKVGVYRNFGGYLLPGLDFYSSIGWIKLIVKLHNIIYNLDCWQLILTRIIHAQKWQAARSKLIYSLQMKVMKTGSIPVQVGSHSWYVWLSNHSGFIYEGSAGHFTTRRELRRGISYWYAYRRRNGKLRKIYLENQKNWPRNTLSGPAPFWQEKFPWSVWWFEGNSAELVSGQNPQPSAIHSPPGVLEDIPLPPLDKN